MELAVRSLKQLFLDRKILWMLVIINFLGSIYGFYWYHEQLAVTPWYLWPWVPDSPFSSSLFTILLLLLLTRKYIPWFSVWANLSAIKYGVWAAIINLDFWRLSGQFYPENLMLTLSHLGMAGEGLIYLLLFSFSRKSVIWTAIWFIVNDSLDYLVGIHPYLFSSHQYTLAWTSIIALSSLLLILSWRTADLGDESR